MSTSETEAVVVLTEVAVTKVREVLAQQNLQPHESKLRVYVAGGGCCGPSFGLAFDEAKADDVAFDAGGLEVVVDPLSLPHVRGATIDFVDSPEVTGFRVSVPRSEDSCSSGGCGGGSCGSGGGGGHGHGHGGGGCGSGGCC